MTTVFVSYARDDFSTRVCQKLCQILHTMKDRHPFELFVDEDGLEPGDELTPTIAAAIDRSVGAVLLVSRAFCDPRRYVRRIEYPKLLERSRTGATKLWPILVEKAPWEDVYGLEDLVFANDVKRPLSTAPDDTALGDAVYDAFAELKDALVAAVSVREALPLALPATAAAPPPAVERPISAAGQAAHPLAAATP